MSTPVSMPQTPAMLSAVTPPRRSSTKSLVQSDRRNSHPLTDSGDTPSPYVWSDSKYSMKINTLACVDDALYNLFTTWLVNETPYSGVYCKRGTCAQCLLVPHKQPLIGMLTTDQICDARRRTAMSQYKRAVGITGAVIRLVEDTNRVWAKSKSIAFFAETTDLKCRAILETLVYNATLAAINLSGPEEQIVLYKAKPSCTDWRASSTRDGTDSIRQDAIAVHPHTAGAVIVALGLLRTRTNLPSLRLCRAPGVYGWWYLMCREPVDEDAVRMALDLVADANSKTFRTVRGKSSGGGGNHDWGLA
jgi:hypothetical protein